MPEWPTLTSLVFHDLCAVYILTKAAACFWNKNSNLQSMALLLGLVI